jgi:hypothetical protein
MSHTVQEAFLLGAHIANPGYDEEERIITAGDRAWKLTGSEWVEMLKAVRGVCMFLSTVCGQYRLPAPSAESLAHFRPHGHGARFWFPGEGRNAEEMSASTLEFCVRNMWEYGFADGDTIADASSHSDAELWSDVIIPAIERGEIEVTVWGEPL